MNNLLINRKYDIVNDKVNWYSALEYLKQYTSVIDATWCDTSSSAGDWSGFLVQRINGRNYMIAISQDNNWPKWGYTLYTGELQFSWQGDYKRDDAIALYSELLEMMQ